MGAPKFANTFEGPNTQNATFLNVTLSSVAVGFIPSYELDTMWMTESIGSGIIMSIVTAQLAQQYLSKTIGRPCSWATTCAINSFVYTIVVVMMGTSSAIFNPAVFFGWAIIGRTSFKNWILMFLAQVAGGLIGCLCAWSQVLVQLNRVPVPLKDRDGKFLYVMVPFKWGYWGGFREDPTKDWLAEAKTRPAWARAPRAWFAAKHWASPTFSADDVPIHEDEQWPHDTHGRTTNDGSDVAAAYVETAKGHEVISASKYTEVPIDDPEYQLELKLDQKNKLMVFAETPIVYTWGFYACWWPHFVAGTTLCHWLSFMTGNASQLTNTNMYLTQPHGHAGENTPGNNYAFLNAVLLAWLVGLAYFLLTASAGVVCTLQLNPAADLAGRILHNLLPIPNKGYSGWNYSPVPLILPFFAAVCGCALMYMSMWSKLYFPFRPYGSMPHWW